MRIYLGDLTYTTVSVANEAFPLNIGYVGAYCRKVFGNNVDLQLFKYIDDLEHAIRVAPPEILALSNYPWNHQLGIELFSWINRLCPNTLTVMGGSNIPHEAEEQNLFLQNRTCIDAYVYLEGELGFAALVGTVLGVDENRRREAIYEQPIDGCLYINPNDEFIRGSVIKRQRALDEFPSPYLTGLMDPFFDGRLSPMIETNRGCPFQCTFCHEGHSLYSKVNFFSMERVKGELQYIADHVPPTVHNLMFSDPNFAMYPRDSEICEIISGYQKEKGWPKDIFASTGKNKKDRIANALDKLNGAMQMWLSVQSMDYSVLENIKRDNIHLSDMMGIQATLRQQETSSKSEIILGLPGETLESHLSSLSKLVNAGIDSIAAYQMMLLHGTEMNSPMERERWNFTTRFRVLPRDFGKLSMAGKNVVEVEEIVVATKDLSFENYVQARQLHFIVSIIYNGKAFAALFKLLTQLKIDTYPLLETALQHFNEAPEVVRDLAAEFGKETRGELWDSAKVLQNFYANDDNYEKLVAGKYGANLLQKYTAISLIMAAEAWANYIFDIVTPMVEENESIVSKEAIQSLRTYCTSRVINLFGLDRRDQRITKVLTHDIDAWQNDLDATSIEDYRLTVPTTYDFVVSASQYQITEEYLDRFGRTHQGIGKALTKLNITKLWRHCVLEGVEPVDTKMLASSMAYALIDEQGSGGVITKR